jgi:ribonuclease P protein component
MSEPTASNKKQKSSAFGTQARLSCFHDLQLVKNNGVSQTGKFCIVVALKTPPDGQRRVAFLISRRYDRLAVRRNRARRLFREVFRQIYEELAPVWMLMIPRRKMGGAKMPEVLDEVRQMAGRLQLWKT